MTVAYLVNLQLKGRLAVVVGGGRVAVRKARKLLDGGARVKVVAPEAEGELRLLAAEGRIALENRPYAPGDLAGAFLAIACTSDEAVNAAVSAEARRLGILVNVADRPALCTFTLPAVVRRGDLTLAVATDGRCPALSRALREELERSYGEEYGALTELMGRLRDRLMAEGRPYGAVQKALEAVYRGGAVRLLAAGDGEGLSALVREACGFEWGQGPG
ncbi:MAG: precorrin-2 dehydrogenase/sirohydrochlorin ferrochelatase family protein [Acidobacteriota bacterium]